MLQNEIAIAVGANEFVVAAFEDERSAEYTLHRFPLETETLSATIRQWAHERGLAFGLDTPFLLHCTEFHERTRLLALPSDAPRNEDDLLVYLMASGRAGTPGADGKPLFGADADFEKTAFLYFRLPNGQFALTGVPRRDLSLAVGRIIDLSAIDTAAGDAQPVVNLQIETPTRAVARYYFDVCQTPDDAPPKVATAFLSVTPTGYAIGLFSPAAGDLVYETAEPYDKSDDGEENDFFQGVELGADFSAVSHPRDKITHAIGEMQRAFRDLSRFQIDGIGKLVWATTADMREAFEVELANPDAQLQFKPVALDLTIEEAVATGLLLSSNRNSRLPTVNLVRDMVAQSSDEEIHLKNLQAVSEAKHKHWTAYAMVVPCLAMLALACGLFFDTARSSRALTARETAANAEKTELQPTLDLWNSYIERFEVYSKYTKQVITLRDGQDRAINLFTELDARYPLALDGSFFVSDLKLAADGTLEMKGLARDEKAITAFVQSLESSKTVKDEQYQKTFGASLVFDLKQASSADKVPTASPSAAPGIVVWTVKGNYAPMLPKAALPTTSAGGAVAAPNPATPNQINPALTPAAGLKPNQIIKSGVN